MEPHPRIVSNCTGWQCKIQHTFYGGDSELLLQAELIGIGKFAIGLWVAVAQFAQMLGFL